MTLLMLYCALAMFFGWLFVSLVGKTLWPITILLVFASLCAAMFCLIALGWLYLYVSKKMSCKGRDGR